MKRKIILFGGTFDPIHTGHIKVARASMNEIGAERVIFVPSRRSPHKKCHPIADQRQRFEMICLAIENDGQFEVSDCEFARKEPSYTLDTVLYFKKRFGKDSDIYWLIGSDAVFELSRWYRVCDLIDNCYLSIMRRGGLGEVDFSGLEKKIGEERKKKLEKYTINTPLIEISSTEIRRRIAESGDLSLMLDQKVADYIADNGLYLI